MRLSAGFRRATAPLRVLVAAALLVGLTASVGATPASAAAVPAAKAFRPVADLAPSWEPETGCSPTAKPGATALVRVLRRTYPGIGTNIVRPCTRADSGHEEGRSIDWMTNVRVPEQKAQADAFVAWLLATDEYGNQYAMARRLGVEYLIWNSRMWRLYDPSRGWTEYSGCLHKPRKARAYDNTCHRTHVHISLSWDGAYERTSYFSGYVACPVFPTPWSTPVLPTSGTDFVPVAPTRLLSTTGGTGSPIGPCRLRGGQRFDLPVLGQGPVPASGVSSVVLRVALGKQTDKVALRAWPTGAATPKDPIAFANPGQFASLVTVPVGVDGSVSLQTDKGMGHLTVDVVGYYLDPGVAGDRFHPAVARVLAPTTVPAGGTVSLDLADASGVAEATSGLLSVTATGSTGGASVTTYEAGGAPTTLPALWVGAKATVTQTVLAPGGTTVLRNTSGVPVTLTADLQGVYAPATVAGGLQLVPVLQSRAAATTMTAGGTASIVLLGTGGVPATGVGALLLSTVASAPTDDTTLTVAPDADGATAFRASSPRLGVNAAESAVVAPGPTGAVLLRNAAGTASVRVDVTGYFVPPVADPPAEPGS